MFFANRWVYTFLYYLALPMMVLRLKRKAKMNAGYGKRIHERFGAYPKVSIERTEETKMLWVHTVSVGESIGAAPLIHQLLKTHADWQVVITCMTPTGSAQIQQLFRHDLGVRVHHVYSPYDYGGALHRFLNMFSPDALVIMETELWPNMLHFAKKYNVPAMLMNARLSEKSAKGYQKFSKISQEMFNNLSVIACQYEADAQRFIASGAQADKVKQTGSLKFDIQSQPAWATTAQQWKTDWSMAGKRIFVAASTHDDEESQLLDAFHSVLTREHDPAVFIIVPRHPERFNEVYELARSKGFRVAKKTDEPQANVQVLIGNTMGEMMVYLSMGDACFVGGSLIKRGGHNPLEPAVVGCPVCVGPHTFNFATVCEMMTQRGGLHVVEHAQGAFDWFNTNWFLTEEHAAKQREVAQAFVQENQGALAATQQLIESLVDAASCGG